MLSFFRVTQRGDIIGFAGLDNFASLFRDGAFRASIVHTIAFVVLFLPLNTFLTLLAATLTRRKTRHGVVFEYIFFTPLAVSMAAYAMIFSEMFRGRVSIVNRIFGTEMMWLDSPATAMATLVMLSVFLDFGLDYILLLSAYRSIDRSMIEAAKESVRTEREQTMKELKSQIAGLAAASAARIIGGHADEKGNSALYDQFLKEAGEGNGNAD